MPTKVWIFISRKMVNGSLQALEGPMPPVTNPCWSITWADGLKECLLYLPLYDQVDQVEIGVAKNAMIEAAATPFKKRILVYGSSIVQGASASRPGLAYPARMSRETGLNFLNLGFSGSAKMENCCGRHGGFHSGRCLYPRLCSQLQSRSKLKSGPLISFLSSGNIIRRRRSSSSKYCP